MTKAQTCGNKNQYATKEEAQAMAEYLTDQVGAVGLGIYLCKFCDNWHLGHRSQRKRTTR